MTNTILSLLQPLQKEPDNEELEKTVQKQISSLIIQNIKTTESACDWKEIKSLYDQPPFWEEVERQVRSKTDSFLFLTDFRRLPLALQTEYSERMFDIIYQEGENLVYAAQQLHVDKKLVDSIFRLFNYSEDMLVIRRMSRRRYTETLHEITGIAREETDCLWNLYQKHHNIIESFVHSKRLFYLEQKIVNLNKQMSYVIDYLDYFSDIIDTFMEEDIID